MMKTRGVRGCNPFPVPVIIIHAQLLMIVALGRKIIDQHRLRRDILDPAADAQPAWAGERGGLPDPENLFRTSGGGQPGGRMDRPRWSGGASRKQQDGGRNRRGT